MVYAVFDSIMTSAHPHLFRSIPHLVYLRPKSLDTFTIRRTHTPLVLQRIFRITSGLVYVPMPHRQGEQHRGFGLVELKVVRKFAHASPCIYLVLTGDIVRQHNELKHHTHEGGENNEVYIGVSDNAQKTGQLVDFITFT